MAKQTQFDNTTAETIEACIEKMVPLITKLRMIAESNKCQLYIVIDKDGIIDVGFRRKV